MKKWTSATLYRFKNLDADSVGKLPQWVHPGKGKSAVGILPLFKNEICGPIKNSGGWFRIRFSAPKKNNSELELRINQRYAEAEKMGLSVTKEFTSKVKTEELNKLMKQTSPSHTSVDVMFTQDWMLITEGAASKCDMVTKFLLEKIDGFTCEPVSIEGDLTSLGMSLFQSEGLQVDNIELGPAVKVKMSDGTVNNVTESGYQKSLIGFLKKCKEVMHIGIVAKNFSGNIRRDFTMVGIDDGYDPSDVGDYDDGPEKDYVLQKDRAEKFMAICYMFKDVSIHCGGFTKLEEPDDENVVSINKAKKQT